MKCRRLFTRGKSELERADEQCIAKLEMDFSGCDDD
jgi:hypothetical protein